MLYTILFTYVYNFVLICVLFYSVYFMYLFCLLYICVFCVFVNPAFGCYTSINVGEILCLLVRHLSCWQTNKQTNRHRWKHSTLFATLRRWIIITFFRGLRRFCLSPESSPIPIAFNMFPRVASVKGSIVASQRDWCYEFCRCRQHVNQRKLIVSTDDDLPDIIPVFGYPK